MYGKELILDLHNCKTTPCDRLFIINFVVEICGLTKMNRKSIYFWEDRFKDTSPHLKGLSALQFIETSNITIHTLDDLKKVFLNIFTCKDFNAEEVANFSAKYFDGDIKQKRVVERI